MYTPQHLFNTLLFALLLILGLSACGKKGPVTPLEAKLPVAPGNVTLSQRGSSLLLGWDIPTQNQDGSELDNLKHFEVYRIDYDPESGCPECRNPQYLLQQIDADFYRSKNRSSTRIYMWDHFVEPNTGYRYKIVPITREEQAGDSSTIHRPCFPAPEPPVELKAQAADRQVVLHWKEPAGEETRSNLLGYNIYRCKEGEYFGTHPLNRTPLKATTYEDLNLENATTYRYTVRTVVKRGEFILESDAAPSVKATPVAPL
jgi:hypothetical protein